MRNKAKFNEDFAAAIKDKYKETVDPVQDAAHVMNHTKVSTYTLPSEFTKSGKEESFLFEIKKREKTDDPSGTIEDYFYIGMEEH